MKELRFGLRTRFAIIFVGLSLIGLTALFLLTREAVLAGGANALPGAFIGGGAMWLGLSALGAYLVARSVRRSITGYARAVERGESEALERLVSPFETQVRRLATDMSRIDEKLKEEHARYNTVLRAIDAGVLAVDAGGRITVCNAAFQEMFDVQPPFEDRPWRECIGNAALADAIEEGRAGRSVRLELEVPARDAGVGARIVVAHVTPMGGMGGAATTVRDVTAIRYLERVRRDFVANISHELRTPIAVIRASAETLRDGALEDATAAPDFLGQIERHSERMGNIVEGLLELARLEAGQQSLAKEPVNVRASAQRAVDLASHRIAARRLAVTLEVDEGLEALADTKGLDQVLSNLVENAAKYATEGGRIRVGADAEPDAVTIRVEDDGPGIPAEHRARIFERFYRIDKGRSRDTGGTGLGLAIVKHLVLAMGGSVAADGAAQGGSVFTVRLGRADARPAEAA